MRFKLEDLRGGFNVFVFFDAQLYANELADAVERGEKTNNTNAVKLDSEMKRRAKGAPRLTNEELQALQPQDLMEIHNEIPEMGTVTIRTNVRISTACRSTGYISSDRPSNSFSGLTEQVWT